MAWTMGITASGHTQWAECCCSAGSSPLADLTSGLQAVLRGPSQPPIVQSPAGSEAGEPVRSGRLGSSSRRPDDTASRDDSQQLHDQDLPQVCPCLMYQ